MAKEWISRPAKVLEKVTCPSDAVVLPHFSLSSLSRSEPEIKKICRQLRDGSLISPSSYQIFQDYLMSHLYVANPQARVGAIQSMSMHAYGVLKARGLAPCTGFKTAETYGFQYISACEASLQLVISYPHSLINQ